MILNVYTDGGARGNPGPGAWAFIIKDEKDYTVCQKAGTLTKSPVTNNQAEYTAALSAFSYLVNTFKPKNITITHYSDSKLLIEQLRGQWRVKDERLQNGFKLTLAQRLYLQTQQGCCVSHRHIPREDRNIRAADRLLNQALDAKLKTKKETTKCLS